VYVCICFITHIDRSLGRFAKIQEVQNKGENPISIVLSLFLFFSVISVFALFETVFVLLSEDMFGWRTLQNGVFFLGNGMLSVVAYISMTFPIMKKLEDLHGYLLGKILLISFNDRSTCSLFCLT
jgi:hypothetical protein